MTLNWKTVAMIMVVSPFFLAAPMTPQHAVAQAPGVDKLLGDAFAAQDRATKAYNDMMMKLNTLKNTPDLDDKEKSIVTVMQQMADTLKMVFDADKATLDALKGLRQMQK